MKMLSGSLAEILIIEPSVFQDEWSFFKEAHQLPRLADIPPERLPVYEENR